ncbi:unnamed protein product [Chrysoparadoxa australica]
MLRLGFSLRLLNGGARLSQYGWCRGLQRARGRVRNRGQRGLVALAAEEEADPEAERFFYGNKQPFADLGLGSGLVKALEYQGIAHSTAIQASAIPAILAGKDVVIGSETGSGKTLAYLLPVLQDLIERQMDDPPEAYLGNAPDWSLFPDVVILAPNRELCEQVLSVTQSLIEALRGVDDSEDPLLTAEALYGGNRDYPYGPGRHAPNIVICTPVFLADYGTMRNIPIFVKARTLVLDEADMLMDGGYKKQLDDILTGFRRRDKLVKAEELPKTQYILAAATLPTYGLKSVDQFIDRAFPDAVRLRNQYLHQHHPAIKQKFIEIDPGIEAKIEALLDVLSEETKAQEFHRTMIFTNTLSSCKEVFAACEEAGLPAAPYHKEVTPFERAENLDMFRSGELPLLVCTDLASRGLDIPSVSRIVQVEFATNVVQHLHRLGRAARAGKKGTATSFYDASNADLVNSIRAAGERGSLDASFSRRRGFRKKFKKFGPSRRGVPNRNSERS